tara:strand:- start:82 stop:753 length:672 start_codon:yes stop_codon:yes gene_type:complete
MNKKELDILLYFLKAGYSTRQLDDKMGFSSKKTKGWMSWDILKKYNINDTDKGKLFVYTTTQARSIIKEIPKIKSKSPIKLLLSINKPDNLKRFIDSFIITDSTEKFYQIMTGETRNIIRNFFITHKKIVGKCQYNGCNETRALETAHYGMSRPEIFIKSADKYKKSISGKFIFDLAEIFEDYLMSHAGKKIVCFLCRKHHRKLDDKNNTKKDIKLIKQKINW